jgi:SAM-dependent methyltransferase
MNPRRHLLLLRCPFDQASLRLAHFRGKEPERISTAVVQCADCMREYPIEHGVLRLLEQSAVRDAISAREQELWEKGAGEYDSRVTHGRQTLNAIEIPPTLRALGDVKDKVVLELGCGTGRLSTLIASACREYVAVDFSINELAILSKKIKPDARVSLVQADVTQPISAPRSFDLILSSQVVQALPTRDHRMGMFRWAAEALTDAGRFVFTTYHHGLRNRLFGIAKSARYTHEGIYRYYSTMDEIKREVVPYFNSVQVRPIQVVLPGVERLGLPPVALSRVAERIPGLKQLGILLLVEARQPVRPPEEGSPSMAVEDGITLLRRRFEGVRERRRVASQR